MIEFRLSGKTDLPSIGRPSRRHNSTNPHKRESASNDAFYAEMVRAYVELYPAHAEEILHHAEEYTDSEVLLALRLKTSLSEPWLR